MNASIEWETAEQASAAGWLYDSVSWAGEGESDDESTATAAGVLGGAAQGATAGAALGPYGALIGGAIGAASAGFGLSGRGRRSRRRGRSPAQQPSATDPAPSAAAQPASAAAPDSTGCERLARQVERLIPLLIALAQQGRRVPLVAPAISPGAPAEPEPADPLASLAAATTSGESEALDYLESFSHPAFQAEDNERWMEASGEELDEDFGERCCGQGESEDAEEILPACFIQPQPASSA